jgi:hypothetical protein
VKSGHASGATLTFEFATSTWLWAMFLGPLGGLRARGPLPLTRRWRWTFLAFRCVAILSAAASVVALFSAAAFAETSRASVVAFALGAFATYVVTYTLYAGLRPKGDVYALPTGQRWVLLRDVHADFVKAVEVMWSPTGSTI